MKIISSGSGKGKSREITKIAARYSSQGKMIHIVSGEDELKYLGLDVFEMGGNLDNVKFTFVEEVAEITDIIKNDDSEAVFIDGFFPEDGSGKSYQEAMQDTLKVFNHLETRSNKSLYVTLQVPNESLAIYDYIS